MAKTGGTIIVRKGPVTRNPKTGQWTNQTTSQTGGTIIIETGIERRPLPSGGFEIVRGGGYTFGGETPIESPQQRMLREQKAKEEAAKKELNKAVREAEVSYQKRDETLEEAQQVKAEFEQEIQQKYGVSNIQELEAKMERNRNFFPIAYNQMAQDYNQFREDYNPYITQAEQYQTIATKSGEKAEKISKETFGRTTSIGTQIIIPDERPIMGEKRVFGQEATQLQLTASKQGPSFTPTTPATTEFARLKQQREIILQKASKLELESKRLQTVSSAAPYFSEEGYKEYETRATEFEKQAQEFNKENKKIETKLAAFEPYSMTPERKRLIAESAPLQIVPEAYGFLGGKTFEALPEARTGIYYKGSLVDLSRMMFGAEPAQAYELALGTKKERKQKGQAIGQLSGEVVLIEGGIAGTKAFLGTGKAAIAPKPKIKTIPKKIPKPMKPIVKQPQRPPTVKELQKVARNLPQKQAGIKITGTGKTVLQQTKTIPTIKELQKIARGLNQKQAPIQVLSGTKTTITTKASIPTVKELQKIARGLSGSKAPIQVTSKIPTVSQLEKIAKTLPQKQAGIQITKPNLTPVITPTATRTATVTLTKTKPITKAATQLAIPGSYKELATGLKVIPISPIVATGIPKTGYEKFRQQQEQISKNIFSNVKKTALTVPKQFQSYTEKPSQRFENYLRLSPLEKTLQPSKTEQKQQQKVIKAIAPSIKNIQTTNSMQQSKQQEKEQRKLISRIMETPKETTTTRQSYNINIIPRERERTRDKVKEKPKPRKTTRIRFPTFPQIQKEKPKLEFGYKVLVRTKGIETLTGWKPGGFKPISTIVLPKEQALALGQKIVAGTAKRTFKIQPAYGKLVGYKGLTPFQPEMFKIKGRQYTEKTKYAIDTPGELEEITFKGLKTKRKGIASLFDFTSKKKRKKKTKRRKK